MKLFPYICCILVSVCGGQRQNQPREPPCPDPELIFPCICTLDSDLGMDCSDVESEEQLSDIFSHPFPVSDFNRFSLSDNIHIQVLKAGVFGNVSFERFYIQDNLLREVEPGALSGSYATATDMHFTGNWLTVFPFEELEHFKNLTSIDLGMNRISFLPNITSSSLQNFLMYANPLHSVSATTFRNMAAVEIISVGRTRLADIIPGTFSGLPTLEYVDLTVNFLKHLPEGTVQFNPDLQYTLVALGYNNISSIAVNAFQGMRDGEVSIYHNKLTELTEEVWRPLFDDGNRADVTDNPFTCGCEMAWIVLNTAYLNMINLDASCADGRYLQDLDPAEYEVC